MISDQAKKTAIKLWYVTGVAAEYRPSEDLERPGELNYRAGVHPENPDLGLMIITYPPEFTDHQLLYQTLEGTAVYFGFFDLPSGPARQALLRAWVINEMVYLHPDARDPEVDLLKGKISRLASDPRPPSEQAYDLWSRIAGLEAWELLVPITQVDPEVAEMISTLRSAWHPPASAQEARGMLEADPLSS